MDNVSHTVAGVVAAEVLLALRARKGGALSPELPRVAWVSSAVANNLPDLDFLYTFALGGKLGYLLHHRGHTHTLVAAVPFALLMLLTLRMLPGWRRWALSRPDVWTLGALVVAGPFLHLALDWTNNYGIHPFWPFDNAWYYGDRIFIIEPLFWACCIPLFLFALRSRVARALWALVLVFVLGLCWSLGAVPWGHAAFLTLLTTGLLWAGRRLSPAARAATSVVTSALVLAAFWVGGKHARAQLERHVPAAFGEWTLRDAVVTPLPTNPLCWEVIAVMTRGEEGYALRRAQVAAFPGLRPVTHCPLFAFATPTTARLSRIEIPATDAVAWHDGLELSLPHFRSVVSRNCHAAAFLRFSRAPFLREDADADTRLIGDLRYDREGALGFAELALDDGTACPRFVPPWVPPRGELLSGD
ncbi:metal-dependent hydrolase [Vitiosangium sp. GDMCC 1.1324]|uniref:metal-dependent hydrolase n=1 Tax=Vitiosangium sp. (strain GDMCC 1.1324) TaxID=2138576 RepID=UPI000D37C080|nr:metal-dependent hydrolase [Vitiosangium sp. GDMCC 1.1324]PTL82017.1 hypothetical protein DAT35_19585 [Vitiosangium sp. GDMCC 1.1324]